MSSNIKYTYITLRYVHDAVTGEFVNVGVVIFAPGAGYLSALCRTTYRRVSTTFPGLNGENFRAVMRHVQSRIEALGSKSNFEESVSRKLTILDIVRSVIPADDSSLQWGPVGSGLTLDPSQKIESLFNRMVTKYDEPPSAHPRRSDDDVWRNFRRDLEERRLLQYFEPKTISVKDDSVQFDHAWKNGVWHCVEPVSFDLSAAETIRDKAHKLLGQLTSINESSENFRLYMLVAKPKETVLLGAYESALSILAKIPCKKEIFQEEDHAVLANLLATEVQLHAGGQSSFN